MTALLTEYVCDNCSPPARDALAPEPFPHLGFVILRSDRTMPYEAYVFETRRDAERWLSIEGPPGATIAWVRAPRAFSWMTSRGTIRGIRLADRLYKIYATAPDYSDDHLIDRMCHLVGVR